jgi:1-deoxy-D-xylulose-5-phosphate reductoisomerase
VKYMIKKISILGSTGSIGTQAIEVVQQHPQQFKVVALTANRNVQALIAQCQLLQPELAVVADEQLYPQLKQGLSGLPTRAASGAAALAEAASLPEVDMVLTALMGYSGLQPTLAAIAAGKDIALANKETLVVAGELIMQKAREQQISILPVDSEHSALYQCLVGEAADSVEKLILTASGGPFRGKKRNELAQVTKAQALKHPNWEMGAKITIDSATLMNKGLEVIEAHWLFGIAPADIEVVVHPQSIIHSLVQFTDGSLKAQLGLPDMKLPIQYALGYPQRLHNNFERFSFTDYPELTFQQPDGDTFKNLPLAFTALEKGGNACCILNAANEIAVERFLKEEIDFLAIADLNHSCLEKVAHIAAPSLKGLIETDTETRALARSLTV